MVLGLRHKKARYNLELEVEAEKKLNVCFSSFEHFPVLSDYDFPLNAFKVTGSFHRSVFNSNQIAHILRKPFQTASHALKFTLYSRDLYLLSSDNKKPYSHNLSGFLV